MRRFMPALFVFAGFALGDPPGATVRVKVQVPPGLATGFWSSPREAIVPPGFQLSVWQVVPAARFMAIAPNGDVFVAPAGSGSVYLFRPSPGEAPKQFVYASGMNEPHGLAFDTVGGVSYLYVAEANRVDRFVYVTGDTEARAKKVIVDGLPDGGHNRKNLAIAPDHRIYVGIGSSCNVCTEDSVSNPVRASIYVYNSDGSGGRLFARGLRNAEGLAFVPGTNTLWAAVNNRDELPYPYQDATNQYGLVVRSYVDDHPADEFTQVRDGGNYGWPFCNPTQDSPSGFAKMKFDLDFDTNRDSTVDCGAMDRIDRGLQAHSAVLQLAFAQQTAFPTVYRNGAMIAMHGSWDRVERTGYKVVYLPWNALTGQPGEPVDLVAGLADISIRPTGVAITSSGSLLISDDNNGVILELSYTAKVVSGASGYALAAPDSYASVYGSGFASGQSLQLIDASGKSFPVQQTYSSASQINFVVPAGVAVGTARLLLGAVEIGQLEIAPTATGLFSVDGSGTGEAAATLSKSADGTTYLSLYGTGIRGAKPGAVRVLFDGVLVAPSYAGAQSTYPALDQVNVAMPAGLGPFQVQVEVDGLLSNTVTISLKEQGPHTIALRLR